MELLVTDLGGEVCSTTNFDPSATHLIMTKPVRSEKLLASIAAGKWIVHHSYLVESHREGRFLPVSITLYFFEVD